jgi:hypothetical protein
MSILSEKIDDFNNDGKEVKDSKASVKKAIEAYEKMKPALAKAEEKKRNAKPKVFKVEIKEEPVKETKQSSINMFGTSTVVTDLSDIGIGVKRNPGKSTEDKEIDFAGINSGMPSFRLKEVDHSNLYKVEANNVLNLNPFQVSFSETELNQYTYQNPMLDGLKRESL